MTSLLLLLGFLSLSSLFSSNFSLAFFSPMDFNFLLTFLILDLKSFSSEAFSTLKFLSSLSLMPNSSAFLSYLLTLHLNSVVNEIDLKLEKSKAEISELLNENQMKSIALESYTNKLVNMKKMVDNKEAENLELYCEFEAKVSEQVQQVTEEKRTLQLKHDKNVCRG